MNDSDDNELRETNWRRKLTPDEEALLQAHLAVHPEAQADWEEEVALSQHLHQLPDVPLSSNFTALVLQAVEADAANPARPASLVARWHAWASGFLPRIASVGLLLVLGMAGLYQYRTFTRAQFAASLKEVRPVAALPAPELFQDFDAIEKLQIPAVADEDLLAALQ